MRQLHWMALSMALLAIPLQAQEPKNHSFEGSAFFAGVKAYPNGGKVLQLGGGGEVGLYKGLKAGGDIGYLFVPSEGFGSGAGLFSAGAAYHFFAEEQTVPFVAAGYGLGFRSGTQNLLYYGAGVTHWFTPHAGARLELRDYLAPELGSGTGHVLQFRVALTFR